MWWWRFSRFSFFVVQLFKYVTFHVHSFISREFIPQTFNYWRICESLYLHITVCNMVCRFNEYKIVYLFICMRCGWFTLVYIREKIFLSHIFHHSTDFPHDFFTSLEINLILIIFFLLIINTCMHSSISAFIIIWLQEFVEKIIFMVGGLVEILWGFQVESLWDFHQFSNIFVEFVDFLNKFKISSIFFTSQEFRQNLHKVQATLNIHNRKIFQKK